MTTTMTDLATGRTFLLDGALPGRDAYEEAVARGFQGSRDDWLTSLRGFAFDVLNPDWSPGRTYPPNAAVRAGHRIWVAVTETTGVVPGTDPDAWLLLLDGADAAALAEAVDLSGAAASAASGAASAAAGSAGAASASMSAAGGSAEAALGAAGAAATSASAAAGAAGSASASAAQAAEAALQAVPAAAAAALARDQALQARADAQAVAYGPDPAFGTLRVTDRLEVAPPTGEAFGGGVLPPGAEIVWPLHALSLPGFTTPGTGC